MAKVASVEREKKMLQKKTLESGKQIGAGVGGEIMHF